MLHFMILLQLEQALVQTDRKLSMIHFCLIAVAFSILCYILVQETFMTTTWTFFRWTANWQNNCSIPDIDTIYVPSYKGRACSNGWLWDMLASVVNNFSAEWCPSPCWSGMWNYCSSSFIESLIYVFACEVSLICAGSTCKRICERELQASPHGCIQNPAG